MTHPQRLARIIWNYMKRHNKKLTRQEMEKIDPKFKSNCVTHCSMTKLPGRARKKLEPILLVVDQEPTPGGKSSSVRQVLGLNPVYAETMTNKEECDKIVIGRVQEYDRAASKVARQKNASKKKRKSRTKKVVTEKSATETVQPAPRLELLSALSNNADLIEKAGLIDKLMADPPVWVKIKAYFGVESFSFEK